MRIAKTLRFLLGHPLGKERPFATLARYARWQVSSRTALGPTVVPFVEDSVLIVSHGMTGATGNVYVGLHECEDMAFFLHFLRPEDLFLDVGANVGSYTVLASKAAGARSVAVEPVPDAFRHLIDNLRLNAIDALVDARCVAVGAQRGQVTFSTDLGTMNHVVGADYAGTSQTVDVLTMDELLDGRVPVAMKIDVEGFEREVLRGGARLLSDSGLKAVLMEVNDLSGRYEANGEPGASALLRQEGFAPFRYDARTRTLSPCEEGERSIYGNGLYIRDAEAVRARLSSARVFRVGPWTI